jgi:hypothetical protein
VSPLARSVPSLRRSLRRLGDWLRSSSRDTPQSPVGAILRVPTPERPKPISVREIRTLLMIHQPFRAKLASFRKKLAAGSSRIVRPPCFRIPLSRPWVRSSCFRCLIQRRLGLFRTLPMLIQTRQQIRPSLSSCSMQIEIGFVRAFSLLTESSTTDNGRLTTNNRTEIIPSSYIIGDLGEFVA